MNRSSLGRKTASAKQKKPEKKKRDHFRVYVVEHADYGFLTGPYWRKQDADRAKQQDGIVIPASMTLHRPKAQTVVP